MWLIAVLLLVAFSQEQTAFENLRKSLISALESQTENYTIHHDDLLWRRNLLIRILHTTMNESLSTSQKISELLPTFGNWSHPQDVYEKSKLFGVAPTEVLKSALMTGFTPRYFEAANVNKTKMIERVIIKAVPTPVEAEARDLEDMLVDINVTPNYTETMNTDERNRIDFLLECVRISSDSTKRRNEKEKAIIIQLYRSRFYRHFLEINPDFNVEDFAKRIVIRFDWVKLKVSKEQYAKMNREEKIVEVIQGIRNNIKIINRKPMKTN